MDCGDVGGGDAMGSEGGRERRTIDGKCGKRREKRSLLYIRQSNYDFIYI